MILDSQETDKCIAAVGCRRECSFQSIHVSEMVQMVC